MSEHDEDDVATRMFTPTGGHHETMTSMVLGIASAALRHKGADPVKQIAGFVLSGDASFIPRDREARSMIKRMDRNEIVQELVREYLKAHGQL